MCLVGTASDCADRSFYHIYTDLRKVQHLYGNLFM